MTNDCQTHTDIHSALQCWLITGVKKCNCIYKLVCPFTPSEVAKLREHPKVREFIASKKEGKNVD